MKYKACRYQAQTFCYFHDLLLIKNPPDLCWVEIRDFKELILSPHCALNQFWLSKGPYARPSPWVCKEECRSMGMKASPCLGWCTFCSQWGGTQPSHQWCLLGWLWASTLEYQSTWIRRRYVQGCEERNESVSMLLQLPQCKPQPAQMHVPACSILSLRAPLSESHVIN